MKTKECQICKEPAEYEIVTKCLKTKKKIVGLRCVDCAHDVCVIGRNDIAFLNSP